MAPAPQDGYRTVEGIEEAKLNDAPPPRRPLRALPFVLLALVPFGAHFFKGALSALQLLLPLSKGEYGLLHSMFALPNATIAPVLGGDALVELGRVRVVDDFVGGAVDQQHGARRPGVADARRGVTRVA